MKKLMTGFLVLCVVLHSAAFAELCHHDSGETHVVSTAVHSCSTVQIDDSAADSDCGSSCEEIKKISDDPCCEGSDECHCPDELDHDHCSHEYVDSELFGVLSFNKELLKAPSFVIQIVCNFDDIGEVAVRLLSTIRGSEHFVPFVQRIGISHFTDRICLRL